MRTTLVRGLAALLLAASTCRPAANGHVRFAADAQRAPAAVERGAVTYATYCAGCHGAAADGQGPVAAVLGLRPADLRAPALRSASDAALVDRITRGTPLRASDGRVDPAEDADVDAVAAYLPRLGAVDWNLLRVGRLVYEDACAPCHGAYGRSEGALTFWLGVPDLVEARERLSDAALARISENGSGLMTPLYGGFDRGDLRALVAYVRHLSDGFRVYDTYCAACHGDDGQGLYSEDVPAPATAAPPLRGPYARSAIVHMLRRERGFMPHFRELDAARIRDVVAYLRTVVFTSSPGGNHS